MDVENISDAQSEAADMDRLFHTSDPDLQKLLQEGPVEKKLRLWTKTKDQKKCMTIDGSSTEEVRRLATASSEQALDPTCFAKLNSKKKKDRIVKNNQKAKNAPKKAPKKAKKAKVTAKRSSESNLVYSH
eukprot:1474527-Pyramimonas_sp.AAC.1